jgi:ABC-type branched-subunit amino acid transport system substrate-binding protein
LKNRSQLVGPLFLYLFIRLAAFGQLPPSSQLPTKIVIIAPQSGASAYFGKVVANGIALSLKSSNGAIDYRVFDDKSDPKTAAGYVAEGVAWGAAAIIGPLDSDVTSAAADESRHLKIPDVSPCATASYLTESGNPWFFRANTSDRQRANEIALWSTEVIGRKGMLIVHESRTDAERAQGRAPLYGEALAADLQRSLDAVRQPASAISFPREGFDQSTQQAIVQRLKADVVGGVAILTLDQASVPIAEFVRSRSPQMPIFLVATGRDLFSKSHVKNGVYSVTPTVIEATKSEILEEFRRRYTLAFPGEPTPTQQCAAYGYDAAEIVLEAIKNAETTVQPSSIVEFRAAVRDQIENTPNDRQGLMSVGGFTKQHELNFVPHRLVLRDGEWVEEGAAPQQSDQPTERVLMYFGLLMIFLATLIAVFVWQLPRLHRFGDRTVIFVISAVVGLVAALVMFGALRSYGHLSGQSMGVAFEFGGPAALFVAVLLLGTRTRKTDKTPFTVTIIVRESGSSTGVITKGGRLSLLLPRGAREEGINNGQVVFSAIDAEYKNYSVDYIASVSGYERFGEPAQLRLTPDGVFYVALRISSTTPTSSVTPNHESAHADKDLGS